MAKPTFFTFLLMSLLSSILSGSDAVRVGSPAPALTVTLQDGSSVDLSDAYAAGPTLLFFYPKADTPGCTAQACNLRDNWADVQAAGIQVFGVSTDGVDSQARFQEKYELPFALIADRNRAVGKAYGVSGMAFHRRSAFLIVDGKVAWADLNASPSTQSQDVLAAMAALSPS